MMNLLYVLFGCTTKGNPPGSLPFLNYGLNSLKLDKPSKRGMQLSAFIAPFLGSPRYAVAGHRQSCHPDHNLKPATRAGFGFFT
jgi:hypothetical protein